MPGQLCAGAGVYNGTKNAKVRNSKAYAEGRQACIKAWPGAAASPHQPGSEARAAWAAGFASYGGPSGTLRPRDCVAERGTIQ